MNEIPAVFFLLCHHLACNGHMVFSILILLSAAGSEGSSVRHEVVLSV